MPRAALLSLLLVAATLPVPAFGQVASFEYDDGPADAQPDRDADGVADRQDKCPLDPEDKDGFSDADGCPDPDNDYDGLADTVDQCPMHPGPSAGRGCPLADRDNDGIPDEQDRCPAEPGLASAQGCPARGPVAAPPPTPPPRTGSTARSEASPPLVAPNGVVAVLPLDVRSSKLAAEDAYALEEVIRTVSGDALRGHGLTVLAGETTLAVLKDNGVDASKACEASCALEAARELKASVFISGSVARSEGEYLAFVRLFHSASGRQLGSLQLEGTSLKSLRREFQSKAQGFFDRALGASR